MSSLKDHIQGHCTFVHYREGNLLYQTELGLRFIIPITDTDGATFPAKEKGIFFMRWIRPALEASAFSEKWQSIEIKFTK